MMTDALFGDKAALDRLRACVMADEALAAELLHVREAERFAECAARCALARGIPLTAAAIASLIRPDPLGLARFTAATPYGSAWPPRPWLPIHVSALEGGTVVDWAHFGSTRLTEPFFEGSTRHAMSHPFNRVFRYRMTLADFLAGAPRLPEVAPSGFIFHMSRCGSTLVSQMLAAAARNIVVSEAAPIDVAVQLGRAAPHEPGDRQTAPLRAMIAAYGRKRSGDENRYFIKLDCWHALALPLFRRAFPEVPWVFLYRDPVEVMVSQMREPGAQLVPAIVPPSYYGIDGHGMRDDVYCARALDQICSTAADRLGDGGLALNYRELPDALWTRILPHFGVAHDGGEREAMTLAAGRDAKSPHLTFAGDSDDKQRAAQPAIRACAELYLGATYRRLEASSRGGAS